MPDLSDYQALMARRTPQPAHVHMQREPRLIDITTKAQTIVDHPGWQWYLDALESRVKLLSDEREALARRMILGTEMGPDLERLKIHLNKLDAEVSGLRYAGTLIPQAVALGQQIATGATPSAAGTSIAGLRA